MSAETPADVIEQAADVIRNVTASQYPDARDSYDKWARALHDAGLLADPADRDDPRVATLRRERDHAREEAELAERDRRTYHRDAIRAEAERDELRADYAALVNSQLLTRYGELGTRLVRAEAKLAQTEVALGDAMAAEVAELRATIDRVRGIHQQHACTGYPDCMILFGGQCAHHGHCNHCRKTWPCPTISALDGGDSQ